MEDRIDESTAEETTTAKAPLGEDMVEEATVRTPLGDAEEEEAAAEESQIERLGGEPRPGSVPLKMIAVKPVLKLKNGLLAYITKTEIEYWDYTPQEWTDLEMLFDACGFMAPATIQLVLALAVRDGAKLAELRILAQQGKLPPATKKEVADE